ncbi:MAG: DUF4148 domain-containing protein [Piscinibacter sp.]
MKLSRITLAALPALFAVGAAVAQEGTQDFSNQTLSAKTRAQVIAEMQDARAAGTLASAGDSYGNFPATTIASTRTRAEVQAELAVAQRARALDTRNYAASYGSFRLGEIASTRSRDDVRAEGAHAQHAQIGLSRGDRSGG